MATEFLPRADLTESGRPVLRTGEIESSILSSVDLESDENPQFPRFKSGLLILTTYRLIWIRSDATSSTAAASTSGGGDAVFIPLGSIPHIFPPKKSIKAMFATPRVRFQVYLAEDGKSIVVDRTNSSVSSSRSVVIIIVLRGKGDCDAFYGKFWDALRGRAWESEVSSSVTVSVSSLAAPVDSREGVRSGRAVVGVSGILRREQEQWESMDKSLQDAFQDLNALMSKAKEMVILAEKMRQKLLSGSNSQTNATDDEEVGSKQEMQDWLLSVGIASPVTKESAGAMYHQQLSRQLADFVKVPLERAGGMINLIDIYCLFNRARGTELISPEDLLRACSIWEKFDVPVMLRKFDSGVVVIQTKSHSDEEVFAKIKTLMLNPDALQTGVSASDAAMTLGIAPAMAKEHLLTAESKGLLCRDISPNGFRFISIYLRKSIWMTSIWSRVMGSITHGLLPLFPGERVKGYGIYNTWVAASVSG